MISGHKLLVAVAIANLFQLNNIECNVLNRELVNDNEYSAIGKCER